MILRNGTGHGRLVFVVFGAKEKEKGGLGS